MQTFLALTAACLVSQTHASIGQEGDPSTCPLLSQNLRMTGEASLGHQLQLNFTLGVPVRIAGVVALTASRQSTVDISGTWNPANWERDGRQGYERSSTVEEVALFRRELQCDTVYMSFNRQRGWWMLHPTFDLGSDGTSGWAIVEAPEAEFPHQIGTSSRWKVITERGIEQANVRHIAEPTPEFFLSMSALIDKNGDEILEATEAADFSFGGVHTASVEMGREWVAQADLNNDGILTMREVADGHAKLTMHALTKRWLESTAVVEATLRLLQRETARVRKSLPASEVDATEGTAGINQSSASSALPPAAGEADDAPADKGHSGWLPFRQDSNCPIAHTGNRAFEWGKVVVQRFAPSRLLAS